MRRIFLVLSRTLATALSTVVGASSFAQETAIFHKPVRLQAEGKDIDCGAAWGHTGPCVADVDGDGLRDLVVGDFSGKFRFFRNLGSNVDPNYAPPEFLRAGTVEAEVNIYCCMGSNPTFADFDGDGTLDLLSGSYDPGDCYWFRGLGQGRFAARETVRDSSGAPVSRNPAERSVGSWPVMVDWDNDGDLDLLVGGFFGSMFVRLNESRGRQPEFSPKNLWVLADGKQLRLPDGGHAAPTIVDWDNDGRWDILSGSSDGAVVFYRNTGEPGQPHFGAPEVLIPKHRGSGYSELVEADAEPLPGIRTQIAACDYDHDGKSDLLVGDFCSYRRMKPGLAAADRDAMQVLFDEVVKNRDNLFAMKRAVREDLEMRFPDEQVNHENQRWIKALDAMRESAKYKQLQADGDELNRSLEKYLERPTIPDAGDPMATPHGYVWLFLRK